MEYRQYTATLRTISPIVGGAPLSRDLAREYGELLISGESNILKAIKKAMGQVDQHAIERYLEKGTSIFHRSKGQNGVKVGEPVILSYQWTAMMRDAAKLGNIYGWRSGMLGYSLQNGGLLFPMEFPVGPTEMSDDRPIQTFKSPGSHVRQASLIKYEFAEAPIDLVVPFQVIQNDSVPQEVVEKLWELAQHIGIGAQRHLGKGKFEIIALEAGERPKLKKGLKLSASVA